MNQTCVIGLDLGTTNAKAAALTADGQVVATSSSGYALHSPHPGWAEQHPDDVWNGAVEALRTLREQIDPAGVVGLCLSGAMHSSLPVGADGMPLAPAMTWADQRASEVAKRLRSETASHALYLRTGCPLQPIYHVAKLRWWVDNAPLIAGKAARFVTLKDYVLYRLSGEWVADLSVYSATGLLDIRRYTWDEEALTLAGITARQLPPLVSPLTVVGNLTEAAAEATGLPKSLPVVAGASDGGLANLGSGASQPGQSVITVGTSGAVRRIVAEPYLDTFPHPLPLPRRGRGDSPLPAGEGDDKDRRSGVRERTWCYLLAENRWFAGGAINNAGLAVQWVREKFYPDLSSEAGYRQLFADAAAISPGAEGVMVLPFFAGERSPYWNASARATITGLGLDHDRRHVARAVLEGVAFRLGDIWDALGAPAIDEPARLTGGITHSTLWSQIVADVLGIPLISLEAADASAIGAALLGFQALGVSVTLEEQISSDREDNLLIPDGDRHAKYSNLRRLFQTLYWKVTSPEVV